MITGGLNLDKPQNILITGPNSPLGQCFISKLINYFPNSLFFSLSRNKKIINFENKVKHIPFDLSKDIFYLSDKIDILVHVSAAVPSTTQNNDDFFNINFEGAKRLIEKIKFSDDVIILNISIQLQN